MTSVDGQTARNLHMRMVIMALTAALVLIQGGLSCAEDNALKSRKANETAPLPGAKVYRSIPYQTLSAPSGPRAAPKDVVPKHSDTPTLINNIPAYTTRDEDTEIPSPRDFAIYRAKRQIDSLRQSQATLLAKLDYCLTLIVDQERFFDHVPHHGQGETYDQIMQRRVRLRAARELIYDDSAERQVSEAESRSLKEKYKL